MFCRFSLPEQVHLDQGRQFESDLIAEGCKSTSSDPQTTGNMYYLQGNGAIE